MHELGIVFQIIKTVERVSAENDISNVSTVTLELGEVSGVVHKELCDCWKWAVKKTDLLKESSLLIDETPAVTLCNSCNETYATVSHGRICPHCKSENTHLVQGDEINLKEIEAS